jgi:hypothetical protein
LTRGCAIGGILLFPPHYITRRASLPPFATQYELRTTGILCENCRHFPRENTMLRHDDLRLIKSRGRYTSDCNRPCVTNVDEAPKSGALCVVIDVVLWRL